MFNIKLFGSNLCAKKNSQKSYDKRKTIQKVIFSGLIITSASILSACGDDDDTFTTVVPDSNLPEANNSCFWGGPYSIDNPASNFAYPDTGATYWHAKYNIPEGATLKLNGEFPYARYMSFNSYRQDNSPAFALRDQQIIATNGSINPFTQGAERNSNKRSYQIELAAGQAPIIPPNNILYDYAQDNNGEALLLYRVYVPNKGKDATGGVGLPTPELTLTNGEVLKGQSACDKLESDKELAKVPVIPPDTYAQLRQNNPAKENPIWRAVYNVQFGFKCSFLNQCEGNPVRQVARYANLDNQYISTYVDRSIKPVIVIRGKVPKVPETVNGNEIFDESDAQVRYWSMCQNEYYSQKVASCLYDEQVAINPDGYYTMVSSLPSDRPINANDQCDIGYLPWSSDGDGFSIIPGRQNNATDGFLLMRNMLPADSFDNAIKNTSVPGDEAEVLGDYLPTIQYFTKAEFEALGCDAYKSLAQ